MVTVFLAGLSAGIAIERARENRDVDQRIVATNRVPAELEALGLSADQHRRIETVLAQSSPAADSAMHDVMARLRASTAKVDSQIRDILSVDQRARLDSVRSERSMMLIRRRGGRVDTIKTP
jgi:hypothetical protein